MVQMLELPIKHVIMFYLNFRNRLLTANGLLSNEGLPQHIGFMLEFLFFVSLVAIEDVVVQ